MADAIDTLERARFVEDLLSYMTLEEKLGQLDLFHSSDDPALEKAILAGRIGGVAGGVGPARLQSLATERSRLGIPLLLAMPAVELSLSPWALAASWDLQLAFEIGGVAARETIGGGYNCLRGPRCGLPAPAADETIDLAACEPYLSAKLAAAFARGAAGDRSDPRSTVLAVPAWTSPPGMDALAWSHLLVRSGYVGAIDSGPLDRTAAQRAGFHGILVRECQRIAALLGRQFSTTSARSKLESAERSIADGLVSEAEIDAAVRGVLAAKHALGLFREPQRIVSPGAVVSPYGREDQRVRASFVLLRNEAGILPLSPVSDRVLVVGAASGAQACADALGRAGIGHSVAPGLAQRRDDETWSDPVAADRFALSVTCDAAKRADFVLVVLEDRHFSKPADGWAQPTEPTLAMLRGLATVGVRLVAIIAADRPVDLAGADQYFAAALHCWQPRAGFEEALCDVLSGRFSPQGRMPASAGRYLSGHGLGFGESVVSDYALAARPDHVAATVNVRNSGSYPARETVQVYARDEEGSLRLIAFAHAVLDPGKDAALSIPLGLDELGVPGDEGRLEVLPGRREILVGKSVSRLLSAYIDITPAFARALCLSERGSGLRLAAG